MAQATTTTLCPPGGQSKHGDRILFGTHSRNEVTLDGEEHLVMKEEDVLGILGS